MIVQHPDFIENKYCSWYSSLIEKAKNRNSVSSPIEIHHIIPKSKGGTKSLSNLITACQTCNNHKGDADYDEYIKRLDRKNLGVSEPQ